MDATGYILLINALLKVAFTIWSSARKVLGQEAIPEWEQISNKNAMLQSEIDAELDRPEPEQPVTGEATPPEE